jgi:type VI protein secretion system component Hcp
MTRVDLGAHLRGRTPEVTKDDVSRRRNIMSEDNKKVEKTELEPKGTELSEQELDKVAGGASAPSVSEIVITKTLDKSSPNLY